MIIRLILPCFFAACLLGAAIMLVAPGAASAQSSGEDYRARQQNLITLSTIFGEMHHVRRMCEPRREADAWRNRMKKLVELEEPAASQRERLVGAFNDGYLAAQKRYRSCDRDARDYAAARAATGEAIVAALMAPLYESMTADDGYPIVQRGGDRH